MLELRVIIVIQIVDPVNGLPTFKQNTGKMKSDKAGSAGQKIGQTQTLKRYESWFRSVVAKTKAARM